MIDRAHMERARQRPPSVAEQLDAAMARLDLATDRWNAVAEGPDNDVEYAALADAAESCRKLAHVYSAVLAKRARGDRNRSRAAFTARMRRLRDAYLAVLSVMDDPTGDVLSEIKEMSARIGVIEERGFSRKPLE